MSFPSGRVHLSSTPWQHLSCHTVKGELCPRVVLLWPVSLALA